MRKKEGFANEKMFVLPASVMEALKTYRIIGDLYFTDIGYFPNAQHHYRERKKGSMQYILIYCDSGEGWFEVEGKREKLRPNQYLVISKQTPHRYGSTASNPWSIYWIHFTGRNARDLVHDFNQALKIPAANNQRFDARIALFEEIFRNLEMGYNRENIEYSCICLRHILGSLKYLRQFRRIHELKEPDMATLAIRYMKMHIHKKIYLAELASQGGLSVSHFSAVFKKHTGRSPLDYLLHLRIQFACGLLDFSGSNIAEVAMKVGFEDQFYFSRMFSKIMGKSPTAYRKIKKG